MKAKNKFGGFAFPSVGFSSGMTLRDYFAGQALDSLIQMDLQCSAGRIALSAYCIADAMLAARERKEDVK